MATVNTAEIAEAVLRRHFSLVSPERYSYPEVLSLHAAVNLELTTGQDRLRAWNRALLRPFLAGELTHRMGAYRLYNAGGAATAKLLYEGRLPEAEPLVHRCVEQLVHDCPRGPRRFLAYQTGTRRRPHELWIDMVFATCPFLLYCGLHFDRDEYLLEAVEQLEAMHGFFFDAGCGLYHQAVGVLGPGRVTEDHWSRGNGWGILALCEIAARLPPAIEQRTRIVTLFNEHLQACLAHQDQEGLWHQEMTDPESYVETSGSGLILYALGVALEHQLCDPRWREHLIRGLEGYSRYIALDGSVHNCCIGCMCPGDGTQEAYKARPWKLNDHHAFGPAALAWGQACRLGIHEIEP